MDNSTIKWGVVLRFAIAPLVLGLLLFAPAGSFDYWEAWVYCAVIFAPMFFVVLYFFKYDPGLLERRMRFREKEKEQKAIVKLANLVFLVGFIMPGLDRRYGWSDVPASFALAGNAVVFMSYMFIFLVLRENSYASRVIDVEKNQKVISTGPYRIIRHPMYSGMILMFLATPIALGSYWACIFFLPLLPLMVLRILNEEKVLIRDLPGYGEYCEKTRFRLIPHIW